MEKKRILLLSAYHADSHRYWAEGLIKRLPEYEWTLLSLPGRFFQWRIRGNPISFLNEYVHEIQQSYDLVIATSMVDVACMKGLLPHLAQTPWLVYFHENQLAYPIQNGEVKRLEPQMVNLYAALAADTVVFNSDYNRDVFFSSLDALLKQMPDLKPKSLTQAIIPKVSVLPVPLRETEAKARQKQSSAIKLVWNHRWEYDKNPDRLYAILAELSDRQVEVDVAIVGQQFRQQPEVFDRIKSLIDKSAYITLWLWGFIESREAYEACLQEADVVLSTAVHDFQGLSVLEAVSCGCVPVLPDDLAYPEWFSEDCLYAVASDDKENAARACDLIIAAKQKEVPDISWMYWSALLPQYRQLIESHFD